MQFKNVHYGKPPDLLITDYPTLNHKLKSFHIQGLHNLKCFCATNALMRYVDFLAWITSPSLKLVECTQLKGQVCEWVGHLSQLWLW